MEFKVDNGSYRRHILLSLTLELGIWIFDRFLSLHKYSLKYPIFPSGPGTSSRAKPRPSGPSRTFPADISCMQPVKLGHN